MYDTIQLIGWVGAASLLVAYALLTSGKLTATGSTYLAVNFFAAIALGLSTAAAHAWPSATVNALWLVIGLVPLYRAINARRALAEGEGEVGQQVSDVFYADAEADEVVGNLQR
jgi:hypothetical protein